MKKVCKYFRKMRFMSDKGFTLYHMLMVIGCLAIFVGILFLFADSSSKYYESNNDIRKNDIHNILNALKDYEIDSGGVKYQRLNNLIAGAFYQIGTSPSSCIINCASTSTESACVDLSGIGDKYLKSIPFDPKTGSAELSKYAIKLSSNGAITVTACLPDKSGPDGSDVPPIISETR